MSGQCYSCGDSFGLFKKEHGCKNCGYVFCSACLPKKVNIPKLNNEKHKVCSKCYQMITRGEDKPTVSKVEPPQAYYKRLAALEGNQPSGGKSHVPQKLASNQTKYKNMSKEDVTIAERLQKLKEDRQKVAKHAPSTKEMEERLSKLKAGRPPPPSEQEMRERLAKLKGQDVPSPSTAVAANAMQPTATQKPQDEVGDLLKQTQEEVAIDNRHHQQQQDAASASQNNLSLSSVSHETKSTFTNIEEPCSKESSEHGEDLDLNEVNKLIQEVAKDSEVNAEESVRNLLKDSELLEKLKEIEKSKKRKEKTEKQSGKELNEQTSDSDNEDEEELTRLVVQQILEDNRREEEEKKLGLTRLLLDLPGPPAPAASFTDLSAQAPAAVASQSVEEDEDDELPWCCICNNDATIRCIGCDYDLFCNRCFKECHTKLDWEDHRTVPFRK